MMSTLPEGKHKTPSHVPAGGSSEKSNNSLGWFKINELAATRAARVRDASGLHEACAGSDPASSAPASVGSFADHSAGVACWIVYWCRSYVELLPPHKIPHGVGKLQKT